MQQLVDLHLHSNYSDGVLTPTALVVEAARLGLKAIAIADHDNTDGLAEAIAAGQSHAVEVVTAVELSVLWQDMNELHLLGYDFDHNNAEMLQALSEFRDFRQGRSQRVLDKINRCLADAGLLPLSYADIRRSAGGTLGRPHIGQALIAAGYVRDMDEAFERYLVPCNEPKRFFPLDEAIKLIHAAGGCAVLAHPPFGNLSDPELYALLDTFSALGLDGLEAHNSGAGNDGIDRYITVARRRGLIVTGGSDFHRAEEGGVVMGTGRGNLRIPYACVEEIRQRSARYKL